MEEVAQIVRAKGFVCQITSKEPQTTSLRGRSQTEDANIQMLIIRAADVSRNLALDKNPALTVIWDQNKQRVWFHARAMWPQGGGAAGSAGEYSIEQITAELVQQKAVEFFAQILAK